MVHNHHSELVGSAWQRNVSLLVVGQFVSIFGSSLVQYAITWDMALRTNSGLVAMLGFLCANLPQAFMSLWGGSLADRYPKRLLINLPDACTAILSLGLALAYMKDFVPIWLVCAVLCGRSLAAGIQSPAVDSYLPQLAPSSRLMKVNSINGTLQSAIAILAPALSAGLIATLHMQAVLMVDAVTAAIGIGMLLLIRQPAQAVARQASDNTDLPDSIEAEELDAALGTPLSARAGIKQAFQYCRTHSAVGMVLVTYALCFMLTVAPGGLNAVFVGRNFSAGSLDIFGIHLTNATDKLGCIELLYGLGAVSGGLLMTAWGGFAKRLRSMGFAMLWLAVADIVMACAAPNLTGSFWLFALAYASTGFISPLLLAPASTLIQEQVSPAMMGRIFGLLNAVRTLALPLGLAVAGPLSDAFPIAYIYIAGGIVSIPISLWVLRSRVE
ncbi:MFS transporter [Bombiscardovia apis]|uniref:MFS transporter n=1 Tax=Bombiscardovia apis TaxID=2932182 RepID=A0ABM8BC79_9BIFI|nr:MFS transporter [Bombiscardovia apis]BDR54484.1 MFS transporter [Bombiscardovia apis]